MNNKRPIILNDHMKGVSSDPERSAPVYESSSLIWCRLGGAARALLLFIWIIGGLLLELLLFVWLPWGAVKRNLIQGWHRGVLKILRVKVCLSGQYDRQQTIACANHISWLDVIVIGASFPACFISKLDVKSWPIIGRLATLAGTIYVDRGGKNLANVQREMQRCLRAQNTLVFFPEGTTSSGDSVEPFKPTLFRVAVAEGVPVQPLHLAYRSHHNNAQSTADQRSIAYIDDDHFLKHLWQRLKGSPTVAHITVLPIIQVPALRGLNVAGTRTERESKTLKAIARDLSEEARMAILAVHESC
jgi:1-acyl-sn-glycerol-3-phosphate acyltransferase